MARGRKVQPDNAQGHTRTRVDKDNPPELEDLTEELFASFEQAFRLFDADNSGTIENRELMAVFESLGQKPDAAEIDEMIREVDKDNSGAIDLTEFCQLMLKQMKDEDDPAVLQEAFRLFDEDGSGTITKEELRKTLDEIMSGTGEKLEDDEIDQIIKEADKDGDGNISSEEFFGFMNAERG